MRYHMNGVLVLNAGYEPLHRVSFKHAIRMLAREVAVVEEAVEGRNFGHYPFPKVLRLVKYVFLRWRSHMPGWSRKRVLLRDNHECAYCGKKANTIDHIIPTSRGGTSDWLNTVAACVKCNNKKADRLLKQTGLSLRRDPFIPNWADVSFTSH
jgi:5-methylcytosine-specific restriction endonuclease McrA